MAVANTEEGEGQEVGSAAKVGWALDFCTMLLLAEALVLTPLVDASHFMLFFCLRCWCLSRCK